MIPTPTQTIGPKSRSKPRDSRSVRCAASPYPTTFNVSCMCTASFGICFEWDDTGCGRFITDCCEHDRSRCGPRAQPPDPPINAPSLARTRYVDSSRSRAWRASTCRVASSNPRGSERHPGHGNTLPSQVASSPSGNWSVSGQCHRRSASRHQGRRRSSPTLGCCGYPSHVRAAHVWVGRVTGEYPSW